MRESILTIPITDVFEPKCGCPICRIRDTLEQHTIEYIMGAAMMEPDVRIETNKAGFCKEHFEQMRACKNRLSLALMLQTHLQELQKLADEVWENEAIRHCPHGRPVMFVIRKYDLEKQFRRK